MEKEKEFNIDNQLSYGSLWMREWVADCGWKKRYIVMVTHSGFDLTSRGTVTRGCTTVGPI